MQRALMILVALVGLFLLIPSCNAQSKRKPLSDAAMGQVTAAGMTASAKDGVVNFQGQVPTSKGLVSSSGSLVAQSAPLGNQSTASLTLNGQAQQNLSSLVNVNAVNSKVNVLLNLNININSTVGSIKQINMNGKP